MSSLFEHLPPVARGAIAVLLIAFLVAAGSVPIVVVLYDSFHMIASPDWAVGLLIGLGSALGTIYATNHGAKLHQNGNGGNKVP